MSSGETHSIREFVELAFKEAGIEGQWKGEGVEETYNLKDSDPSRYSSGETLLKINKKFYRPAEVDLLLGDSTPIREELGWKPEISFDNLVASMVQYDIGLLDGK